MHCTGLRQTRRPFSFRRESELAGIQSREQEESLSLRATLERIEEEDKERGFARKMETYGLDASVVANSGNMPAPLSRCLA
jgi:hypothetical protein